MGVGCGAAVLTAQYWGSKELSKLKQVMTLMFRIVLIAGTVCMLFVMGNSAWILSVYTKDEQVIMYGVKYMKILQYTLIFYAVSIVSTQVLRSVKMMKDVYKRQLSCWCFYFH